MSKNESSPLLCDSSNKSWETPRARRKQRTTSEGVANNTGPTRIKESFGSILRGMGAAEHTDPESEPTGQHRGQNISNDDDPDGDVFTEGPGDDRSDNNTLDAGRESESVPTSTLDVRSMDGRSMASSSVAAEKLGVVSMAVLLFYNVSGGPFGIETTVRAGGNRYAILGFLVAPLVWSLQEALMTAELGTAFPEASGGVAWVEEAFGPLAGWMAGYLSWVSGATDNAIYPVLFLDYLLQVLKDKDDDGDDDNDDDDAQLMSPVLRFCLLSGTTILLAYVNWRGLAFVGKMSILICVIAMSPFVVLVVIGSFKVDPSRWWKLPTSDFEDIAIALDDDTGGGFLPNFSSGGILWRPFLNNLFWNLNSFDSAGCLVAELDSNASFVWAMMLGLFLVVTCYFFPLLIAIGSSDSDQADWTDGYMAAVNAEVVGPWLGAWTVFAAAISNIGLFQAELSSDAFQLMGMADRGYLPKVFRKRSKYGTPTYAIVLGTTIILAMGVSDIDRLVEMLNFNYGIALLFEYAAFFKLRISRPNLERPYRIPLNTPGCAILFFPTIVSTFFVCSLATYTTYVFAFGSWIVGYLLYTAGRRHEQATFLDSVGSNQYTQVGADSLENDTIEFSEATEDFNDELT